ncbi:MAG TPA: glycosyltransferase [Pyrinomonadaceae bacterium]|jgi:glycosyltransferase involved in cell wall biosynthesis|nr:glycosyltransferase [Pyrinomonadaceae bacterium]
MNRVGVMHVTDTLDAGGTERVAVNLCNLLPRDRFRAYLCTTRRDGSLADSVADDVGRLRLGRTWRFDAAALRRLAAFVKEHDIKILHAHGSALFVSGLAAMLPPRPALVWHDHFGLPLETRSALFDRPLARRARGVIAVSQPLADWSREKLRVPAERVRYIPNFVCAPGAFGLAPELPGEAGARIVCVANLRPQKDHLTLIRAMAHVARRHPAAHLLLVGASPDANYRAAVVEEIARRGLARRVTLLGERRDVHAILRACDIGVLSSIAEGLPLALVEYATAGLASVATRVGQCAEVLDDGRAGLLVPAREPDRLAEALSALLGSPARRAALGETFRRRARLLYSADSIVGQVCEVYERVLGAKGGRRN